MIQKEEKITVLTNTGEVYTGNFTIKEDSLVILEQGCVSLNDIEKISVGYIGLKIIGGTLAGVGGVSFVLLGVAAGSLLIEGVLDVLAFYFIFPVQVAILVPIAGVNIFNKDRADKKTKWNYEIKKIES